MMTITLETYRDMMRQVQRLGPLQKVMGMIPGMGGMTELMNQFDESETERFFGMIDSMTPEERRNPGVIDQSRRRRIATGSGVEPQQVNKLVKQFDGMASLMKEMSGHRKTGFV